MIGKIYDKLPKAVSLGINGARRVRQTAVALGRTGLERALWDRSATPDVLRKLFERLGATYIKLGQFVASSPSLFPEAYVTAFQQCMDRTEPVPFHRMVKILNQDLGADCLGEIFADIDPVPLASASIAQVYAATLTTGEKVVIKIQRPGVADILVTDLNFLYYSAVTLETVLPRFKHASLSGMLSEIRKTVLEECDFIREAENIAVFAKYLEDTGNTTVMVPRVYPEASTRRVLTMERLFGIPLTDRKQLLATTSRPGDVLGPAFETWMSSVMGCALFHADLHAGNLLIMADGRVGFIDFGIVGRISEKTRNGVKKLVPAMITLDFVSLAEAMTAIGMTREKVDTARLAHDLKVLYDAGESGDVLADVVNGYAPAMVTDPDRFMLEMVRVAETHGIRFPREFTLLLKQFLYFDGYRDLLFDMGDWMDDMMPMDIPSGMPRFSLPNDNYNL
jgi:aarF domain-containing kinase